MRKRLLIAGGIAVILIGGLTALAHVMELRIQDHINSGIYIPLWERILFGIDSFWLVFWWMVLPFVLLLSFGVAIILDRLFAKLTGSSR